jgi:hypothetical protein
MLEKKWSKMAEIVPEIFKTDENLETGQNWWKLWKVVVN